MAYTTPPQLHPLELNPVTGEPFLRLAAPLDNIIITPPRLTDTPDLVKHMNDVVIAQNLFSPPRPYLESHAESSLASGKQASDAILQQLAEASATAPDGPPVVIGGCPVRIIREVGPDGSDIFIGDVTFFKCRFQNELMSTQKALVEENTSKPVGDPTSVWCITNYLASSHQGRGISTAALKALIHLWAVPRMNLHLFRIEIFKGNDGSMRLYEKLGFTVEKAVDIEFKTTAGFTIYGHITLWWRRPQASSD